VESSHETPMALAPCPREVLVQRGITAQLYEAMPERIGQPVQATSVLEAEAGYLRFEIIHRKSPRP